MFHLLNGVELTNRTISIFNRANNIISDVLNIKEDVDIFIEEFETTDKVYGGCHYANPEKKEEVAPIIGLNLYIEKDEDFLKTMLHEMIHVLNAGGKHTGKWLTDAKKVSDRVEFVIDAKGEVTLNPKIEIIR